MAIKILNWNVEQFGSTRSANNERLNWVCKNISDIDPDIASIVEIKTINPATAILVANRIVNCLQNTFSKTYNYILSYDNDLEMHLFLYNTNTVDPICLGTDSPGVYNFFGNTQFAVQRGVNTTFNNNNSGYLTNLFPLINYPNRGSARPPALAFFQDRNTNDIFPILAWHNMAKTNLAKTQMGKMIQAAYVTTPGFTINISGTPTAIPQLYISGDFNVNALDNNSARYYTAFTNYTTAINAPTMLVRYPVDCSFGGRSSVVNECFDNFIWRGLTGRQTTGAVYDSISKCQQTNQGKKMALSLRGGLDTQYYYDLVYEYTLIFWKHDDEAYIDNADAFDVLVQIGADYFARTIRITDEFLDALYERLSMHDIDRDTFDDFVEGLAVKAQAIRQGLKSAEQVAIKSKTPGWCDALFFHRTLMSDHLPVVLTIN